LREFVKTIASQPAVQAQLRSVSASSLKLDASLVDAYIVRTRYLKADRVGVSNVT
jgi:hypothetical protein